MLFPPQKECLSAMLMPWQKGLFMAESAYFSSFAKTFFIYDHDIVQREEDDPKLAVVFFHPQPPLVSEDMQCLFSGQVMAMVNFLNTLVGCKPRLYRLKKMKIATVHAGRFTMAMASSINTPDEVAILKLQNLFGLFNFFHGSITRIFKEYGSNHDAFVGHVATIMPSYLSFVHYHDNKVRESFQDVPMVLLPKGSHLVYLKASHLLQWLKRRPKLLGGCILYKHKVLCTQLTPQITRYLLVVRSKQHHLPAVTLSLEFEPPVGVKILAAFLTEKEYSMFGKIPSSRKLKAVNNGESRLQTSSSTKEDDLSTAGYTKDERKDPKNDGREQRSSVPDSVPQEVIGENEPARNDEDVKNLQFAFENSHIQGEDISRTAPDVESLDVARLSGQGGKEKNNSTGGSSRKEKLTNEEIEGNAVAEGYGAGRDIFKDGTVGEDATSQDCNVYGADQDDDINTEIHFSKSERRFDGILDDENTLNGDLGSKVGVNTNCPGVTEDICLNSSTKMHSSDAESSCSGSQRDKSDADKERVARRLTWGEGQTDLETQEGCGRLCNTERNDLTSEEVNQTQNENSGYTESLKHSKDYLSKDHSCDSRSLLSKTKKNLTKPMTRSGVPDIEDRMENKGDSNSSKVKGHQSLLDNSGFESDQEKRELSSTDEADKSINTISDEDFLQEPQQKKLSNWPPMGHRSISSCSSISSQRTSVFTEGEKSRSVTDDSDNVFDMKVRTTSTVSSSKTSEDDTLCTQVHSEDLVVIFLAEKSLGTDEDSVKKMTQIICSQAAELEEGLKAVENTSSKDQPTIPYNYMGYNSFEHSLTTKLEAQVPADDVKFFHGARMLHNEFNKDADLSKVHLGSSGGTVVAEQLPGSQEFFFVSSNETGLSLTKTSPTKTQSKTKVPFGDVWNRR